MSALRVVLFRHGPAGERDSARSPNDDARPLTSRGEERTRVAAAGLARLTGGVRAIWTSPLTRAAGSAALLREAYGEVRVQTVNTANGTYLLPPVFSATITGNSQGYPVHGCARYTVRMVQMAALWAGGTTADGMFTVEDVECIAACTEAPCLQANYRYFQRLSHEDFDALVEDLRHGRLESQVPRHGILARTRQRVDAGTRAGSVAPDGQSEPAWMGDTGAAAAAEGAGS